MTRVTICCINRVSILETIREIIDHRTEIPFIVIVCHRSISRTMFSTSAYVLRNLFDVLN